jgi:acyl-CoA thioester hydrolase
MARPPPERLQLAAYPWSREDEPRFGDMDALRHLNNVAIARLYEDARVRFTDACGFRAALEHGHGLLVAEVAIQYLGEGHYPDPLIIGCGVGRIGTSSFVIAQGLFQRGACIGTAETTLVHVARREGGAVPLTEAGRSALLTHRLTLATDAGAAA